MNRLLISIIGLLSLSVAALGAAAFLAVYREGAERAAYTAARTLRKVQKKVGFIPR